jgi:hypothetical protein
MEPDLVDWVGMAPWEIVPERSGPTTSDSPSSCCRIALSAGSPTNQ